VPTYRRIAAAALAAYSVLLAVVLLNPSQSTNSAVVTRVTLLLQDLGVPAALTAPTRLEFALNVAIFLPLGVLLLLTWPRLSWRDATAYGFVVTCGVEMWQGLVLDDRVATFSDVAANTLGACLGGAAIALARLAWPGGRAAG
jgi:glycopeptide antibiotics resistance protein